MSYSCSVHLLAFNQDSANVCDSLPPPATRRPTALLYAAFAPRTLDGIFLTCKFNRSLGSYLKSPSGYILAAEPIANRARLASIDSAHAALCSSVEHARNET